MSDEFETKTKEFPEVNEEEHTESDNLLDRIYDIDNKIVVHNKDTQQQIEFHCGDLEKRKISFYDGHVETLWVSPSKSQSVRKVFIELLVKRISAIDNVEEQYRMKFIINYYWIAQELEYKKYYKYQKMGKLCEFEPLWVPQLEFQNAIEHHSIHFVPFDPPKVGNFKIIQNPLSLSIENKNCKFICCRLECDITFAEELELQSFPMDCQDLTCSIIEKSCSTQCEFLPLLLEEKRNFSAIDPKYSIIDEWDLESALLEFGHFKDKQDIHHLLHTETFHSARIVLRLKMKRRYFAILLNVVIPMAFICGLSLTTFALDAEHELGDRLNLLITLILTVVAFQYTVFEKLPNVAYLTFIHRYVLMSYSFLSSLMIENACGRYIGEEYDKTVFMKLFIAFFFIYQLSFAVYAIYIRFDELKKLQMNSDEIEAEVNFSRAMLHLDYSKAIQNDISQNSNTMKYAFIALAPN